ncbi:hypothetical protein [Bradyrhizobium guangdongense]|nr:hypothetical protein [Bradyrhizobium guangdongense]
MSTEIVTTCINCVPPGSLWATLFVVAIGALAAIQYERQQAR